MLDPTLDGAMLDASFDENQLGGGAVARAMLSPARGDEAAPVVYERACNPSPHKARVLIIDDELAICNMLKRVLQSEHDVVAETSARSACARLAADEHFDVIFCDITMPGMSGMELYQRLREHRPDSVSRIVFMTGGTFTESAQAFVQSISNRCIAKPFTPTEIRHVVNEMASPHELAQHGP